MSIEAIVRHDTSQVRMSDEENTKQIVCLTFVPVGTIIETGDRWNRCNLVGICLDADTRVVVNGQQVVNDLKAVTSCWVVNTSDVGDLSELRSCMILEKFEYRDDGRWSDIDCQLVFPDGELLDLFGKTRNKVLPVSV